MSTSSGCGHHGRRLTIVDAATAQSKDNPAVHADTADAMRQQNDMTIVSPDLDEFYSNSFVLDGFLDLDWLGQSTADPAM